MALTTRRYVPPALAVLLAVALLAAGALWPRRAEADWRSLLGAPLPAFSGGVTVAISPDSQRVAFISDRDSDDVQELYAVPFTGALPLKLNPPLPAGADVRSIQFTPDGQSVLYLADQEVVNRVELWRVPVGGGAPLKLNTPLVAGGNVLSFRIDGKNNRVVYVADQTTNEIFELWSISLTGGGLFKLNGTLTSGGDIGIYQLDPLSNRVVYSADQDTDGTYELYSVPILGGPALKLNPAIVLQGGGDAGIFSEWAINPVIPVVVFVARQSDAPGGRLMMIPTAGGQPPLQLNFNLLATQRLLNFRISPAGDRVVFNVGTRSGSTNAFKGNLHSVLIGGGGAADLTEPAEPLFGVDSFRFTPDGRFVIYSYQKNAAATPRLESSTTQAGVRAALYNPSASDPALSGFDISPDSAWVLFRTATAGPQSALRAVPPTGGSATNHGLGVYKLVTPDSGRIVYTRVVSASLGTNDLFSAQIFGGDERNLSGLGETGFVGETAVSPDGAWIVFVVQIDGRYDLRASDGRVAQATPTRFVVNLPLLQQ